MNIEISIIIPAFRVGAAIVADTKPKLEVLESLKVPYELVIVLDGPDLQAEKALTQFAKTRPQVKVMKLAQNYGKGYAVRAGMAKASGKFIGYMDVDNDINPKVLADMYSKIKTGSFDGILPSKRHVDSIVKYPGNRKVFSKLYNTYVRYFLGLKFTDTQLGAKLYKIELIKQVLPKCTINRFIFELEMLTQAQALGFTNFDEIPVTLELNTKSTIRLRNAISIISETLKFSWDFKIASKQLSDNRKDEVIP